VISKKSLGIFNDFFTKNLFNLLTKPFENGKLSLVVFGCDVSPQGGTSALHKIS